MAATILLVDSDLSNCGDWKNFLQNQGYKVFAARNGRAAIEQCPLLQPDLVLLNASLSDMHGFQVCQHLKADPQNRLTPVILIMPASDSFEPVDRFEVRADDFWHKPTSCWEALSRVQAVLQLKSYIDQQTESVLFALARSIELKDPTTAGHSQRLSGYAFQLGEAVGLAEDELEDLRLASLVHDIGKVAVPDAILLKPGPLTPDEARIMRQHPVVGEEICAPLKSFRNVLPIIRHHHERTDGSGYPDGLRGDSIPLAARILQVADIYDALTTDRPYRRALTSESSLQIMYREASAGQLDSSLIEQFSLVVSTPSVWNINLPVLVARELIH